jgi:predicted RNase H-like nuclease (RuvC/YqgF family)
VEGAVIEACPGVAGGRAALYAAEGSDEQAAEAAGMMSLDEAEAEFIRLCKQISQLEKRLSAVRKRAEKLAHYTEIAREEKRQRKREATQTLIRQSTVTRLRTRRRDAE